MFEAILARGSMAQQSARRGWDNQGFPPCFEHALGDLDPARELPYRPAADHRCITGRTDGSFRLRATTIPKFSLAKKGASTDAIALLAALGLGVGQILQIIGVQRTSAAAATIILATIPIFTVVLAVMRLRQTLHPHHAAGLIVALIGIGLTTASTSTGTASLNTATLTGDACLLLSSVCIAAYYVLGTELAIGQGVMLVSAWSTIFGAMFLSPPQSSPHFLRDIKESRGRGADPEKNREAGVDGGLLRTLGG